VLRRLWVARSATTVARWVPGGKNVPADHAALIQRWDELAGQSGATVDQVRAMWALCGTLVTGILESEGSAGPDATQWQNLSGTSLPWAFARWAIEHEWVERIEDLVERRLMLIYEPGLSRQTINELADLLIAAGKLDSAGRQSAIDSAVARCQSLYGRALTA
jgi:glycerol-3-phosphate dehydrogenase